MTNPENQRNQDELTARIPRGAKIIGAWVVGAVIGYGTAKGVELFLPTFTNENLYEGVVSGMFAVISGGLTSEVV